jgi:hypothetical protein
MSKPEDRIAKALQFAFECGSIDGEHHKTWVIDQMVRALTEDSYDAWIKNVKAGDDGIDTYEWYEGIAP